jgi:hypothetical protein
MSIRSRVLLCAVGVLACRSAVQGTPIAITNYSFESDAADTSPGSYYGGGPPTTDWSIDQGSFAGVGPNLQQPGVAEDQNQFYVSTVYGGASATMSLRTSRIRARSAPSPLTRSTA